MNQRDKEIIDSLKKFRVLDRDQLIEMHFTDLKQPKVVCNRVMKRLRMQGLVKCDATATPYNYFDADSNIKKESTKIPHFKSIANFFIECSKLGNVSYFEAEYKVGDKGSVEPDVFMIFNKAPFFVEIQRSIYTKKVMDAKMQRYKEYYESGEWTNLSWQGKEKYFPFILIITDHRYQIKLNPLKVYQESSMTDFFNKYVKR